MKNNAFNHLRYSKETIAELWEREDYRIFSMKMDKEGNLVMISSNHTNSKLYHTVDCTGKNIYEFMKREQAYRWHARFHKWKVSRDPISYIAFFEDPFTTWETSIEVIGNTMFGIGQKMVSSKTEPKDQFYECMIEEKDDDVVTYVVSHTPNGFTIESNGNVPLECESKLSLIGENTNIVKKNMEALDPDIFYKCLESQKIIRFFEKHTTHFGKIIYEVSFIPLCFCDKILVYLKKIHKEPNHHVFNIYPKSHLFGVCELNVQNLDNPYLLGSNAYFKELIAEAELKASDILHTEAFMDCTESSTATNGHIQRKNKQGELVSYFITLTPMLSSEKINSVLITICNERQTTEKIYAVLSHLTPREKEVLSYVLHGSTNAHIADQLKLSETTVKRMIRTGYQTLNIRSRLDLAKIFYSAGINIKILRDA